ncbi:hypothetical protein LMF32_06590 [Desemzia sp. C1]|uniref:hypothetical protein n=1 Tax=Desemzia sp. C1 TaxID=2892016 RepID=UPI001E5B4293|nr:hypothetical protein [Desemzia sp. C1]MCI3028762.1 hypothetical protein [Desemzia sp. C1]
MELLNRIEDYRKVDLKRVSESELFDLTLKTMPCLSISARDIPADTKLFRVRRKQKGAQFKRKTDVWYPESKYVTERQRLNDVGEPILYTSLDKATPFYESKAKIGDSFAHFEYVVKNGQHIQATSVGMNEVFSQANFNGQGNINNRIIEQFLHTEFTKDVGIGTEYLYRISIMLAKNFYDIPHCDGYMYPSVAIGKGINIAIKPDSVDKKLQLTRVTNLVVTSITDNGTIGFDEESQATSIDTLGNINY